MGWIIKEEPPGRLTYLQRVINPFKNKKLPQGVAFNFCVNHTLKGLKILSMWIKCHRCYPVVKRTQSFKNKYINSFVISIKQIKRASVCKAQKSPVCTSWNIKFMNMERPYLLLRVKHQETDETNLVWLMQVVEVGMTKGTFYKDRNNTPESSTQYE